MDRIAPAIVAKLVAIGIKDPLGSRWKRGPGTTSPKIFSSEHVCWCTGGPRRIRSIPFEGGPDPILLGQCSDCGKIVWSRWLAEVREWSGPTLLVLSLPIYNQLNFTRRWPSQPEIPPTPFAFPRSMF